MKKFFGATLTLLVLCVIWILMPRAKDLLIYEQISLDDGYKFNQCIIYYSRDVAVSEGVSKAVASKITEDRMLLVCGSRVKRLALLRDGGLLFVIPVSDEDNDPVGVVIKRIDNIAVKMASQDK